MSKVGSVTRPSGNWSSEVDVDRGWWVPAPTRRGGTDGDAAGVSSRAARARLAPKCEDCGHPLTFHGGERTKGKCGGFGCYCAAWRADVSRAPVVSDVPPVSWARALSDGGA
jgi:hypothetical protein